MNKFQRGAVASFALAIVGGTAFSLATVFSEASVNGNSVSYSTEERRSMLMNEGYKVIYHQGSSSKLGEHHFSSCNNPSDFMLIDNNWRPAGSENFEKVICR